MRLLAVCFSPSGGAVADIFSVIVKNLSVVCSVVVISPSLDGLTSIGIDHICVDYDPSRPLGFFSTNGIFKIIRELKDSKFDAVLWFSTNIVNILMLPFVKAERHYLWCHEPQPNGRTSNFKKVIYYLNDHILAKKATKIFVAGNSIKEICPQNWQKKIEICPFPALDELHDNCKMTEKTRKDVDVHSKFKILFFGGIQAYKGLDILALALRSLMIDDGRGGFSLAIVGAGDLSLFPELIALERDFPADVNFNNKFVELSEIYESVCDCDVVVFPYLSATGTTTLSVVFSLGKVVIASALGNFSDYITHGKNGFLVREGDVEALADTIYLCSKNRNELSSVGIAAKAFFDINFNPQKVALRLFEVMKA